MKIPFVIVFLGLLIFFSHAFNALFSRTKIPNVLLLLIIGIIVGPVAHLVPDDFFGNIGSVFTTITLIIILFESGTNLKFKEIKSAFGVSAAITILNFVLGAGLATVVANMVAGLSWINAVFLGVIVGGTSSAVVIPMVKQLNLGEKNRTILFLESALSDVICLVIALALLEGMKMGEIDVVSVFSKMWKAFLFAALMGIGAGFLWSILLKLTRTVKNSMFTTLAFVFIVYGLVESVGLNGGIAALCFGIILGNSESINNSKIFKKVFAFKATDLSETEKNFFAEIVFILQTYFFVYVGLSIKFGNLNTYLIGLLIVGLIIASRPLTIKLFTKRKTTEIKDIAIMSIMTPKGLVPAVLASIPLQLQLDGGDKIQDLGYSIVLFSILICSLLVIIISKDPLIFNKMYRKAQKNIRETREGKEGQFVKNKDGQDGEKVASEDQTS